MRTLALVGEIEIETGGGGLVIVTLALPTAFGTAWLVAWIVTVAGDGTTDGAVYKPLIESTNPTALFPPITPFTSHFTLWFVLPITVAENDFCALTTTFALAGLTLTPTEFCSA